MEKTRGLPVYSLSPLPKNFPPSLNPYSLFSGSGLKVLQIPDNFPLSDENIQQESFEVSSQKLLKLLNKTKISISNDETRHYLNGIYLHKTKLENKSFLCGVATDSHRLSLSSLEIDSNINIEPVILPKKTIFQINPEELKLTMKMFLIVLYLICL